jgi:rubredoxin
MTEKKHLHITKECPDCGNRDGLLVIPGQGATFYYCPVCYDKKKEAEAVSVGQPT